MDAVIHYAELGLKGKNRPYFEIRLTENIRRLLAPLGSPRVDRMPGRIFASLPENVSFNVARPRLACAFGVAYFAPATPLPRNMEGLKEFIARELAGRKFRTFAIRARRMDKAYPLKSEAINREIGAAVGALFPEAKVDLDDPELEVVVEVMYKSFLVYFERFPGPGGLPVGVSGRVLTLLSGGIDSPVAAWRMMKRGCRTTFVHFHSMPFTSRDSVDKVRDLAARLEPWQGPAKLHVVPFAAVQQEIVTNAPSNLRVILYRRFMARIAESLARRDRAAAIVTGESLGQVASQTLNNLATIEDAVTIPILRPLIGTDKQEIIDTAKNIGTFDISALPHDDCCSYLMPRSPATTSTPEQAREAESRLDVNRLVGEALAKTEEEKASA